MDKVFLRDFQPPYDRVVYFSMSVAFLFSGLGGLHNSGIQLSSILSFGLSIYFAVKLLGVFQLTKWMVPYVVAGRKGLRVKFFLGISKTYYWTDIERLKIGEDGLMIRSRGTTKVYYYSMTNNNQQQLLQLFKTIAPEEYREIIL